MFNCICFTLTFVNVKTIDLFKHNTKLMIFYIIYTKYIHSIWIEWHLEVNSSFLGRKCMNNPRYSITIRQSLYVYRLDLPNDRYGDVFRINVISPKQSKWILLYGNIIYRIWLESNGAFNCIAIRQLHAWNPKIIIKKKR